jgi:Zn-dependent protease with chaperone function
MAALAAIAGVQLEARRAERRFGGEYGRREVPWPGSMRVVAGAYVPIWIACALGIFLPAHPSPGVGAAAVVATAIGVAFAAGMGLRVSGTIGWAVRASPEIMALPEVAGIRRIYVLDVREANAFALPWVGDVGVTRPALEILDREELAGVLRHEGGHLAESIGMCLLRLAPAVAVLLLGWWRPIHAQYGDAGYVMIILVCLVSATLLRRLSPGAERDADRHGHDSGGAAYARALEKLYAWQVARAGKTARWTHPALYDRMVAAGVTPSWARPVPSAGPEGAKIFLFAGIGSAYLLASMPLSPHAQGDGSAARIALARGGEEAFSLVDLGWIEARAEHHEQALVYFAGAAAVDAASPQPHAYAAISHARLDRCDEAARELDAAKLLFQRANRPPQFADLIAGAEAAVQTCRQHR